MNINGHFFYNLLLLSSLLISIGFSSNAGAQQRLEIIPLKNRSAEQVLPQVMPFLEPNGTMTGNNYQIFLRASEKNREQIREMITAIDMPLRRLRITVKHEGDINSSNSTIGVSGNVGNSNTRIIKKSESTPGLNMEIRHGDNIVRGSSYSTQGSTSENIAQQLQVVEGGQAYIQIGQSLPLPLRQVIHGTNGAIVSESTIYRDIGTGFYAAPTVSGDYVTLEISPTNTTLSKTKPGVIHEQRLSTTVNGRLGEWIELGGSSSNQDNSQTAMTSYSTRFSQNQRRVSLKVEELQ